MATIRDVAKAAGVSITTVSRALNGYDDVNTETKKRILKISKELAYTPNYAAKNLASKQSNSIGFLFSDVKETDMNGNIIFRLLKGAQSFCDQNNYDLIVLFTNEKQQKKKSLFTLCQERNLGGIILYGLKSTDPYVGELAECQIPCVGVDVEKAPVMVGTDNQHAVDEIIGLFYEKGRRRIGMINGAVDADISRIREMAFIQAMRARKLELFQKSVRYADYYEERAYQETFQLMKENPDLDGIFAASDQMAIGVIHALQDMGKRVPEDVCVAGIDGIQIGAYTTPSLTTVVQDFKEMGKRAAFLVSRLQKGEQVDKVEYVSSILMKRNSL